MQDNIYQYNEQGEKHGYWELYFNGKLWRKANYVNGNEVGYYQFNYQSIDMVDKIYYAI